MEDYEQGFPLARLGGRVGLEAEEFTAVAASLEFALADPALDGAELGEVDAFHVELAAGADEEEVAGAEFAAEPVGGVFEPVKRAGGGFGQAGGDSGADGGVGALSDEEGDVGGTGSEAAEFHEAVAMFERGIEDVAHDNDAA